MGKISSSEPHEENWRARREEVLQREQPSCQVDIGRTAQAIPTADGTPRSLLYPQQATDSPYAGLRESISSQSTDKGSN
jgi:hypothetical protein